MTHSFVDLNIQLCSYTYELISNAHQQNDRERSKRKFGSNVKRYIDPREIEKLVLNIPQAEIRQTRMYFDGIMELEDNGELHASLGHSTKPRGRVGETRNRHARARKFS